MPPGSRILIVDDDADLREGFTDLLATENYNLAFASNGQEALDRASEFKPDLILMDVMMPIMDGFDACRHIRADPLLANVPIIMLTALNDPASRLQGIGAGADDFLSKPFDLEELKARMRTITWLNRYRRLIEERSRFEQVIAFAPNGIMIVDAEGTICLANPAMLRLLDAPDEASLRHQNILALVDPDTHDPFVALLSSIPTGEFHTERIETVFVRFDGTRFPAEVDTGPFQWEGKAAAQIIVRDITERKQIEAALQKSEEWFRNIYTQSPIGIELYDASGKLLDANKACLELFGVVDVGEMKGSNLFEDPNLQDEVKATLLKGNVSKRDVTFDFAKVKAKNLYRTTKSGTVDLDMLIAPLNLNGEITGYLVQVQDITERKRAEEQIRRQIRRLSSLRNIDRAITASMDLDTILHVLLEQIVDHLRFDAASVLLFDLHTQTLEYAAGRGFRDSAIAHSRLRLGGSYAGRAALQGQIISIPRLPKARGANLRPTLLDNEGFVSYYAAPLTAKNQIKGVLEIFHRTHLNLDPEGLGFLEALAAQTAIAIDNAELFDSLQRANTELAQAYDATLEGWSRALELRDKETVDHTRRVTEMTLRLARAMGIEEAELVHIRRGALLHDIGKMAIPDGILLKPGPLTEAEEEIMSKHPDYARNMLFPIPYLRPALDIPYCHHEKWDGTGYPQGLQGEQIPLAARIFAVVDVWDALCSNRPYRPAWAEEKTLTYICEQSGQHFDPQVVDAFLKLVPPFHADPA